MRSIRRWAVAIVTSTALVAALFASDPALRAQSGSADHWVGTWATAVVPRDPHPPVPPQVVPALPPGQPAPALAPPQPALNFLDQTIRQIVHTSLGGGRVRVVVSNAFGTAPLVVGAAQVALRNKGAAIVPGSSHVLTFSARAATTVPPGAVAVSDPVALNVPALSDLAVDLYLPGDTGASTSPLTMHQGAQQTNYVSATGNHAGETDLPVMTTTRSWFFLSRVEVSAPAQAAAIIALGDSITDGTASSVDGNARWPDVLARRLAADHVSLGVLNLGIAGNRLLLDGAGPNALSRIDRDVFAQSGAAYAVVFEGINDIRRTTPPVAVDDLILAHRQIIARAHSAGLKVYGVLLMPFEPNQWSAENEAKRQALNSWIRTGQMYDGVIDFDAVVRDPAAPTKIVERYDSGDHLHPNDAGYLAMGQAVSLDLFKGGPRRPATTD
jgi:lysophospholipase L1-like esterase